VLAPFSVLDPAEQGSVLKARLDELYRSKIDLADEVPAIRNGLSGDSWPMLAGQDSHNANIERSTSAPVSARRRPHAVGRTSTTERTSRPDTHVRAMRVPGHTPHTATITDDAGRSLCPDGTDTPATSCCGNGAGDPGVLAENQNPNQQPDSTYDERTDQWTTLHGDGVGLIVYVVVHERQRLIILRLI
jgi:hypothetical protein